MKRLPVLLMSAFSIALSGCGYRAVEQYILPDQIKDSSVLYESNCSACHGRGGRFGAARPLNDPLSLALIGRDELRDVIAKGVRGTAMPAFAQTRGGGLTDQQIAILADQMAARWSRPTDIAGVDLPPYSADRGDPKHGEAIFQDYCARCHGANGTGGAVVDPAFLALASDQSLRTTVIAGRADEGAPDWRNDSPGRAMTPQEIFDVVGWLSAQRNGRNE